MVKQYGKLDDEENNNIYFLSYYKIMRIMR